MLTSSSENGSSQSVLSTSGIVFQALKSSAVNAPNIICFEKRLDKCWADLKIKFDHEAPLNYSESNYTKINTPQNIYFDSELSVEEFAI